MTLLQVVQKKNKRVRHMIAVAAGKGGVGKSSVTVNLALYLQGKGWKVGMLDADVYGPSLEQMLPAGMEPVEDHERPDRLLPALTFGMPFISVAHFKQEASIVRAPIANSLMEQFLEGVEWGELDVLLLDFPPGTGDIQLTLMQKAPISGAVVVTTPQQVAALDVRKAVQLFQKMHIPVLGVMENMSYLVQGGEKIYPFGSGAGKDLAKEFALPFLGQVPIDPAISQAGDLGQSLFELAPDSLGAEAFRKIGELIRTQVQKLPSELPEIEQVDPFHLVIGKKKISLQTIQKNCPCVRCKGKGKSDERVSLLEFSRVGRYAFRFTFSLGCKQGIYPISLLAKL